MDEREELTEDAAQKKPLLTNPLQYHLSIDLASSLIYSSSTHFVSTSLKKLSGVALNMKFYDAHIHFFYECPLDELRRIFGLLETMGLGGIDVLVIAEYPAEMETVLKMIPGAYHPYSTPRVFENQRDPSQALTWPGPLKIVPFLDARFIENQIEQKIKMFGQRGFEGLKLLYVPEEDPELRVGGMEKTFGRTCKRSEEITALLIESASSQGMSVMMHVDLRKYGKFVEEMIRHHPQTNFNIPHFGFARRAISSLLER